MSVPIVREVREYLDRVTSNYNKYVSNYSDQLLCSMYYDTVVPFIRSRNRIPTDYRFIKECLGGSRKSPVDPMDLSTVFSPRRLSSNVFNTFNNAQLTSLTPLIEMYTKNESDGTISPIPLQNIHGKIDIMEDQSKSYAFLGVQDITIDLKGDSFETRKRDIEISIIFYANNLSVFDSSNMGEVYLPLIHPFHKNRGSRFRLMLKTGWNDPTPEAKKSLFSAKKDEEKLEAIKRQKIIYELQYTKHVFNFNEDGSFTVQVDYVSSIEDSLYDISYTDADSSIINYAYSPRPGKNGPAVSSAFLANQSRMAKQIDSYIRENHPSATTTDKSRIYSYFSQFSPKQMSKKMATKKETMQDRNRKVFHDMIYLLKDNNCAYTVCAKKSIVQNQMFVRALNAASFADSKVNMFGRTNYKHITDLQKELTGLYIPSANEDGEPIFNIEDFQYTFSPSVFASAGSRQTFYIAQFKKHAEVLEFELSADDYKMAQDYGGRPRVHPSIWHVFEVYRLGDVLNAFLAASPTQGALGKIDIALGPIKIASYAKCFPAINASSSGVRQGNAITSNIEGYGFFNKISKNAGKSETIPLYDIPITYQMLQRIVAENFASTSKNRFTYFDFFNALMSRVVKPFFLEGDPALSAGQATTKGVIRTFQRSIRKDKSIQGKSLSSLAKIFSPGDIDIEETKQVHLTLCGPADSKVKTKPDVYRVGSANSVIKSVQFNQPNTDVERARATDNAAATYRNEESQLIPQLFNVQMNLVGNMSFYPGYVFELRPANIGLPDVVRARVFKTLGIAGFYFTTQVQHKIGLEGFTTKIIKSYNFGAS